VRIYIDDAGGRHPIHGAIWNDVEQRWTPMTWDAEGFFIGQQWPRSVDIEL
jgi:hypothetical protein